MADPATYRKHADLVARMAAAQGVDLEEAALRGQIDPEALHDVVLSCTSCTDPADCTHWLEAHQDGDKGTPGYCRNADLMAQLAAGGEADG